MTRIGVAARAGTAQAKNASTRIASIAFFMVLLHARRGSGMPDPRRAWSKTMKKAIDAILVLAFFACAVPARAATPIRVMLLDGEQAGAYHNWQETSPYLLKMLAEAGIFQVDRITAPPAGGDFANFKPDWTKY